MLNEAALIAMTESLGDAVARMVEDGRFPVVHGGDCTTLLGTIPALRRSGPVGLFFVDGHEDTMPLDVSEDGEAANTEIGLLLGLTGRLLKGPLADRVGVIGKHEIVILGPRDEPWRQRFNVGSLRDHGVWFRDWQQTSARPEENARDAVRHLRAAADRWWLHVDLDVLDPEAFAAQGVPGDEANPVASAGMASQACSPRQSVRAGASVGAWPSTTQNKTRHEKRPTYRQAGRRCGIRDLVGRGAAWFQSWCGSLPVVAISSATRVSLRLVCEDTRRR